MNSRHLALATHIMVLAVIISVVLLFVGIAVLGLIHVCLVSMAFRRASDAASRGEACNGTMNGLSPGDLEKLPCYEYKVEDKASNHVDCAVCLESFERGDRCRLLPLCRHSFHARCVDSWLLKSPFCPTCRRELERQQTDFGL